MQPLVVLTFVSHISPSPAPHARKQVRDEETLQASGVCKHVSPGVPVKGVAQECCQARCRVASVRLYQSPCDHTQRTSQSVFPGCAAALGRFSGVAREGLLTRHRRSHRWNGLPLVGTLECLACGVPCDCIRAGVCRPIQTWNPWAPLSLENVAGLACKGAHAGKHGLQVFRSVLSISTVPFCAETTTKPSSVNLRSPPLGPYSVHVHHLCLNAHPASLCICRPTQRVHSQNAFPSRQGLTGNNIEQ